MGAMRAVGVMGGNVKDEPNWGEGRDILFVDVLGTGRAGGLRGRPPLVGESSELVKPNIELFRLPVGVVGNGEKECVMKNPGDEGRGPGSRRDM
jgi:hypothetical protein